MSWDRVVRELQLAHAWWHAGDAPPGTCPPAPDIRLAPARAEEFLSRARELVAIGRAGPAGQHDSALIVTKAPHTGSNHTVAAIVARCLAFGLTVDRVARLAPEDADRIAHALYPDVWLNFSRTPTGDSVWSELDRTFSGDAYARILGTPYNRSCVVTGLQACRDNSVTRAELMSIWQTGREPLTRAAAATAFGPRASHVIFDGAGSDAYDWYRGRFPVGIHRIGPSLMAFSLRHERLYGGRPVIVLNGHYTLLSEQFRGSDGRGATIIRVALDGHLGIQDLRLRVIGAADQPAECRPGTIRRDAHDGMFLTDAPDSPLVPWANAVHASDGYLAGAIETAELLGREHAATMNARLLRLGFRQAEIDALVMTDPIVKINGDEQRLTKRTAMLPVDDCVTLIGRWFPPLGAGRRPPASAYLLSRLIQAEAAIRPDLAVEEPCPEPGSRPLETASVATCAGLPAALGEAGLALIGAGGLALLTPLAGSGGRFGGYDVAEGHDLRLKPLRPVFLHRGEAVSALDIRSAHARDLAARSGAVVPVLLSCSQTTEPRVRQWLGQSAWNEASIASVPEMYRLTDDHWSPAARAVGAGSAGDIVRDDDGNPLLKPSGSLGMLIAAACSGTLDRWRQRGIHVVAAANADDVGFRVNPRVVGYLAAHPEIEAVVLAIPIRAKQLPAMPRVGLVRDRSTSGNRSVYVEENAEPSQSSSDEHYSTNQIYFRLDALCRIFADPSPAGLDAVRARLPVYFEVKQVPVGQRRVNALHAYQTYADVLRLLSNVVAVSMTAAPSPGQCHGYAPLKSPADVQASQAVLDAISSCEERPA